MSWRVPLHRIRDGTPLDLDDMNDNFRVVVEEVEGNLNEHNIKSSGLTMDHVADSAIMRPYRSFTEANGAAAPAFGVSVSGEFNIPQNGQWSAVTGATKTFLARGGPVWIMASCFLQAHRYGVKLALRINGALDPDTEWPYGDAEVEFDDPADVFSLPSPAFFRRSAGETALLATALIETVTAVPPGPCTVELVARTAMEVRDPAGTTTQRKYSVYHRELIVIEV